jgi:acyl dehydratase
MSGSEETKGALTTDGLDGLREKIGADWAYTRWSTWNEEASRDAIRHFAFGYGDDNPMWWDPDYAATTRWGGIIAPPTFLETAGITPSLPPRPRPAGGASKASGLPGLSMFWAGDSIRFFNAVREGDRIAVRRFYLSVDDRPSREFGRTARAVRRRVYTNQDSDLIAIWDAEFAMAEHRKPKSAGESTKVRHHYSDEELAKIDEDYAAETVRGAEPRYAEDVQPGDAIDPRVKGPMTLSDMIAWLQGAGRHEMYPYRLCYKNRRRLQPFFYPKNSFGAYEPVMRGHWDDEYARSTGLSGSYDFGVQRTTWMVQAVTDWAGDDAIITSVEDRLEAFTTIGDVTRITGTVSAVDSTGQWPTSTCAIVCTNQDGVQTGRATVAVRLPSRTLGLPPFPDPPADGGLLPGMPAPLAPTS